MSSMEPVYSPGDWLPTVALAVLIFLGVVCAFVGIGPLKGGPHRVLDVTKDFEEYRLMEKEELSHDTRKFTFALPEGYVLGLPTGQHMTLKFTNKDGQAVQRSYTPVTDNTSIGKVSFVIKVYKAGVHPKFPEGGQMSQHLESLSIGDKMLMKGPKGHMEYFGKGNFKVKPLGKKLQERSCNAIGMMAGGTGITPMLQILHFIFRNPNDKTRVKMIYANQTEDDILVRDELEALQKEFPDRFSLHYTVDKAPEGWKFSEGFINRDMIEKHLIIPGSKQQFFMCGPPPMIKFACIPGLAELGFSDQDHVTF
ncbi:Nitrate reductase [NADH] (Fragment) [Seminavis robusta]|uniref:NADH-cytochrome b5 reductase n=1 Tax=Seminavis robusta TaxID=568900 RepID=A0A9N8HKQ9_9STRA